jgi:hypothetical protein
MAVHPAISVERARPMEDPLFEVTRGRDSLSLGAVPSALQDKLEALRARVGETYRDQLSLKVRTVLHHCKRWHVQVVVFPEYAIPWQLLPLIAEEAGQMVVIAGTHVVDRDARQRGIYAELGWSRRPPAAEAVCPVIHAGRLIALQPKLGFTSYEQGLRLKPGSTFEPVELPSNIPGPMALMICRDFLDRESGAHREIVGEKLAKCRFVAVPSYTPTHSLHEFSAKGWESARRYGKPVLYADVARNERSKDGGGTTVYVDCGPPADLRDFPTQPGWLEPSDEGVIVTDVDLGFEAKGPSTRYDAILPFESIAAASFVYSSDARDASYARWLAAHSSLIERDDDEAVESLSTAIEQSGDLLSQFSDSRTSRGRRLQHLLREHTRFTDAEAFRRCLREIEFAPEVLSLSAIRSAMSAGAGDALRAWQTEFPLVEFATVLRLLEQAGADADRADASRFSPTGAVAVRAARNRIRGDERVPQEAKIEIYRRAFVDSLEADQSRGAKLFEAEDYAGALDAYQTALAEANELAKKAPEDDQVRRQIAAQHLRIAHCYAYSNNFDALTLELREIEPSYSELSAKDRETFLNLLAAVGKADDANRLLESGVPVENRDRVRDVLEILSGKVPATPPTDPAVRALASQVLLRAGRAATAVAWGRSAYDEKKGRVLGHVNFVELLVDALWGTVYEDPKFEEPIPVSDRAPILDIIESGLEAALAENAPGWPDSLRRVVIAVAAKFYSLIEDEERLLKLGPSLKAFGLEADVSDPVISSLALAGQFDEALARLPASPQPWLRAFNRIRLLAHSQKFDEATAEARAVAAQFPGRPPVELMLTRLLLHGGQANEALAHAQIAYELLPARTARIALGLVSVSTGDVDRAWQLLEPIVEARDPAVLQARAVAAEHAAPDKARGAWELYVARRPEDLKTRVRLAAMRALSEPETAADEAWTLLNVPEAQPSAQDAYMIAQLQPVEGPRAKDGRSRIQSIAELLQRRFPGNAQAESLRMMLLAKLGFPEGAQRIDYDLLTRAGILQAVDINEAAKYFAQQHQLREAHGELYRRGVLSVEQLIDELNISTAEFVTGILDGGAAVLVSPQRIAETPVLSIAASEILTGEIELFLIDHFELWESLRQALGSSGSIVVFDDVLERITDSSFQLNTRRQPVARERADALAARLEELSIVGRLVKKPVDEAQLARDENAALVTHEPASEGLARLTPRQLARRLFDEGRIDQAILDRLLSRLPPDEGTDSAPSGEGGWVINWATLHSFFEVGALDAIVSSAPRLLIGRETIALIVDEKRRYQSIEHSSNRAAALARMVHRAREEGWLRSIPRPELLAKLPSLKQQSAGEVWEAVIRTNTARALAYKEALVGNPTRRLLTLDFFTAALFEQSSPLEVLLRFAWTPEAYGSSVERYRPTGEQIVSFAQIVRLLLSGTREQSVRLSLVKMGVGDALDANTLLYLAGAYRGLVSGVPSRLLDIFEAPARIQEHPGRAASRWSAANVYARAIWKAYARLTEVPDEEATSRVLPIALTLLDRAEQLDRLQAEGVLEQLIAMIYALGASRPRAAFIKGTDDDLLAISTESRFGRLMGALLRWATGNPSRRAVMARAFRHSLLQIDEAYDGAPPSTNWMPLLLAYRMTRASEGRQQWRQSRGVSVEFVNSEEEAAAIISADWEEEDRMPPLGHDGVEFRPGEQAGAIRMSFDEILRAAATRIGRGEFLTSGFEGFVQARFPITGLSVLGEVLVAPEALALRMDPQSAETNTRSFSQELARMVGPHDAVEHDALVEFAQAPNSRERRRALARRAVITPWRAVREDPTVPLRWGRSFLEGPRTLDELRAFLAEPEHLPDGELLDLLFERVKPNGVWSGREDAFNLALQASEIPGGLAGTLVATIVQQPNMPNDIGEALERLAKPQEQPIGRLARDIVLVRAAAARQPRIQPTDAAAPVDLIERLPVLFARLLEQVSAPAVPGTLAFHEAGLMRLCRRIVGDLAHGGAVGIRDGLWLTYRLSQWYLAQLERHRLSLRPWRLGEVGDEDVPAVVWNLVAPSLPPPEPVPPDTGDLLDPKHFHRDFFDYRLAAVLHALAVAEIAAQRMGDKEAKTETASAASVSSEGLIRSLTELAARPLSSEEVRWRSRGEQPTFLPWHAPGIVPDLALQALLRIDSTALPRLPMEARMRFFEALPNGTDDRSAILEPLAALLMIAAANNIDKLTPVERAKLRERARMVMNDVDFLGTAAFLLARLCQDGEREAVDEVGRLLERGLNDAQAPVLFGEYLMALSRGAPDRLTSEARRILETIKKRNGDVVAFTLGVGRVAFLGSGDAKAAARSLLLTLNGEDPYRDDSRFRQILQLLGLP